MLLPVMAAAGPVTSVSALRKEKADSIILDLYTSVYQNRHPSFDSDVELQKARDKANALVAALS